jgi:hypothetical protein
MKGLMEACVQADTRFMPRREEYEGLSLADAVRHLAERHFEKRTRHISKHEYELLQDAATALDQGFVVTAPPLLQRLAAEPYTRGRKAVAMFRGALGEARPR